MDATVVGILQAQLELAERIIAAKDEYIKHRKPAINEMFGIAYTHGYREKQTEIDKGVELWNNISDLTRRFDDLKNGDGLTRELE